MKQNTRIKILLVFAIALVCLATLQLVSAERDKEVYVAVAADDGGSVSYQGTYLKGSLSDTITVDDGVVAFLVDPSTYVTFTAIPDEGMKFTGWSYGDGTIISTTTPYTVHVEDAIGSETAPLTAHFALIVPLPEYPLAGLIALISCFGAFVIFKRHDSMSNLKRIQT